MKRQGAEVCMVHFPFVVDRREKNINVDLLMYADSEEMGNTGCLWKGNQEVETGEGGDLALYTLLYILNFEPCDYITC